MIAKRIQLDLVRLGCADGAASDFIDGDYGARTEAAVRKLQQKRKLPDHGAIDLTTWQLLTLDALPSLFQRCLSVSADFEGHGFGAVTGNSDGSGLRWGLIGFTLKRGEIQGLLAAAEKRVHDLLPRVMGPLANEWAKLQREPLEAQLSWADSISEGFGKAELTAEWRQIFARLGDEPIVKYLQMERAKQAYYIPAAADALRLQLRSELGLAFAFDVHVQNGGFTAATIEAGKDFPIGINELERRRRLAELVAGQASSQLQAEVYKRKLILATGIGEMHARPYRLTAWGLNETPIG